jgi:hypothetical protein
MGDVTTPPGFTGLLVEFFEPNLNDKRMSIGLIQVQTGGVHSFSHSQIALASTRSRANNIIPTECISECSLDMLGAFFRRCCCVFEYLSDSFEDSALSYGV